MKSILLHVYDDTGLESRLQAAFDLARTFEGHVTCLHATPFEDYLAIDPLLMAYLPEEFSEKMKALRFALQARIEDRLRSEGLSWDWMHVDELPSRALIGASILADVVVVSLSGGALFRDEPRPLAAAVATKARAPVLAVPESLRALDLEAPVLIAWNGSSEAAAALRSSLPILRQASAVHIIEVQDKPAPYPRDAAARYLARHGIEAEISQRPQIQGSTSRTIESAGLALGAGMIVMGAYGHSRLREYLLGGVTHDLIGDCRLPLLLGH
ncbi:universal stress protein [Sphingosinicella rhizophila]|uniref:Universal stress protein n=1 Tax=Sphingosinicella rhizophila TaxID=3050082 RepID=A0ABU3Q6H2_9SPHN|nr:universal stress protein [Sphingosinicella sp. GR2756]MDT9599016.1 universal stress protein [Sphingosinicella sp. GR2756]